VGELTALNVRLVTKGQILRYIRQSCCGPQIVVDLQFVKAFNIFKQKLLSLYPQSVLVILYMCGEFSATI
jgi:hypothetical protein